MAKGYIPGGGRTSLSTCLIPKRFRGRDPGQPPYIGADQQGIEGNGDCGKGQRLY